MDELVRIQKPSFDKFPGVPRKVVQDTAIAEQYMLQDKLGDAFAIISQVLEDAPDFLPALWIQCQYYIKSGHYGLAYVPLLAIVQGNPGMAEGWNNLGSACIMLRRLDEADQFLRKALKIDPKLRPALNNSALLAIHNCDWKRAQKFCEESFKLFTPEEKAAGADWDVWETYGYAKLAQNDFAGGFAAYDKMAGKSKCRPFKPLGNEPYWDGTKGKKIYLRGEQGVGDEIHFASILAEASQESDIVLDCDAALEGVFKRSFPHMKVYGTRKQSVKRWQTPDYKPDYHALMGTLSKYYRPDEGSFHRKPFLIPCPDRTLQWRALLDTLPGLKVGFTWQGGLPRTWRARRTIGLRDFEPFFKIPGITWVSLGYEDDSEEKIAEFLAESEIKPQIYHWKRAVQSKDFDDHLALINELDLIITVPTAVVHLAGSIGKETWVLRPKKARWFYYQDGVDGKSVWYPNTKCFDPPSDWASLIKKLTPDLQRRAIERMSA